jgi:hypothetical protein
MAVFNGSPDTALRAARDHYFESNGFGPDGGYNDAWVDFKLGPIPFPIKNTAGRVRAVRYHDLNHVLTGYDTDLLGELEISAWEVGSGCADHYTAWAINLGGMGTGALLIPRRTWRAFVRGRHSQSLYGETYDDALLDRTVGAMRDELGLEGADQKPAQLKDAAAYAGAVAAGIGLATLIFTLSLPSAIVLNTVAALRRKPKAEGAPQPTAAA